MNFIIKNKTIGFVPTMGALHPGHISLIRRARRENDITVVSIFVNPTQFGHNEDFNKYPRPFKKDIEICRKERVDLIFAPGVRDMYPEGFDTIISVGDKNSLSDILCGAIRPGHFKGVATVVSKLFNIVRPTRAYFGQKDYQQLKIIERMTKDLNFTVKIIPCPTVREPSGLAMSSRNVYLGKKEKEEASSIYKIISEAKKNPFNFLGIREKILQVRNLEYVIKDMIEKKISSSKVEYVSIRKSDLSELKEIYYGQHPSCWRILVAVRMKNGTRLIDNV